MSGDCGLNIGDRVYFHHNIEHIGTVVGYVTEDIMRQINEFEYRDSYDASFLNWALVKMDNESDYCHGVRQVTGASYVAKAIGPDANVTVASRAIVSIGVDEFI